MSWWWDVYVNEWYYWNLNSMLSRNLCLLPSSEHCLWCVLPSERSSADGMYRCVTTLSSSYQRDALLLFCQTLPKALRWFPKIQQLKHQSIRHAYRPTFNIRPTKKVISVHIHHHFQSPEEKKTNAANAKNDAFYENRTHIWGYLQLRCNHVREYETSVLTWWRC
jgi:hypothetical protein